MLSGKFTQVPDGNVPPAIQPDRRFSAPFRNKAEFASTNEKEFARGEYRQFVKGTFEFNGAALTHILCGAVVLKANEFQEDGCPPDGCTAYGYRSCFAINNRYHETNSYKPSVSDGPLFGMDDAPGFSNPTKPGVYRINLSFKAELIDTDHPTEPLATAAWTVDGSLEVPAPSNVVAMQPSMTSPPTISSMVARRRRLDAREWEVVVGFAKRADAASLHASHLLRVRFVDQNGALMTPRRSHEGYLIETGNPTKSTATAIYRFVPTDAIPSRVEVAIGQQCLSAEIEDF
jgi:hypothetical protein